MKRTRSRLIETFLEHVDNGLIADRDSPGGKIMLENLTQGLRLILDGEHVDKALKIERSSGKPANAQTFTIAAFAHRQRKAKQKWAVIELRVNNWLKDQNLKPVTLARIQKIHKEHRIQLQGLDDLETFINMAKQAIELEDQKKK